VVCIYLLIREVLMVRIICEVFERGIDIFNVYDFDGFVEVFVDDVVFNVLGEM